MDIFNRIGNLSSTELHDLQDVVLAEIQRRKVALQAHRAKRTRRRKPVSKPAAETPATVPISKRGPRLLSPRRHAA